MILYHGGLIPVPEPDLSLSRQQLDFGGGFYTTTSFAQAAKWSKIKSRRDGVPRGYISSYELDESIFKSKIMQIRKFRGQSRAWLTFVMHNRKDVGFAHPYDIVQGAVANDRVYACINAFEGGFIDFDTVIRRLRTYALADQISFHTDRAVKQLRFLGEKEVVSDEKDS